MYTTLVLLLVALAGLAIFKVVPMVTTARQRASKARQLGCEPVQLAPNGGFLGYKLLRRLLDAEANGLFPDFLLAQYREHREDFGRPVPTIRFNILGQEVIQTSDPINVQAVLATQFDDFCLGPDRRNNMIAMLGDGIFVQDGKAWEHSRAMLRPNFVRDQIADLDSEEKHVRHLMLAMPTSIETVGWTAEVNLQHLFFRFTLDSATEFLFGASINSQLTELPCGARPNDVGIVHVANEKDFAFAFDNGQRHLATRFSLAKFWWLHNPPDFRENIQVVNGFVDHFVSIAMQPERKDQLAEEGRKSRYIFSEYLAQQTRNPIEIRSQLLNVLLAARDTTAALLSYLFHHLLRRPEYFAKLRATILSEFGTYSKPKNLSFASLKGCIYLQHCINETLRITPVVPVNIRQAARDTTLPRGGGVNGDKPCFVKKDQYVQYAVHVMHQRPDIWGPDSYEFKPERWEGLRPGWAYLPFNGGPRICIGQQFAITETSYIMVRMLQRFDKLEGAGDELTRPITTRTTLTAAPGKGPIVRLHAAGDCASPGKA